MNRDNLQENDKSKPNLEKGNQVTTYEQEPTTWIPISENELPEGITNQGIFKVFEYRQVTNQGHSNDVTVIEESCIQETSTGTAAAQTDYLIDKHKYSKEAIKPYFLNYLDDNNSKESEEFEEDNSSYNTITTESSVSKVDAQIQVTPKPSDSDIEEYLKNLAEQVRLKAATIIEGPILPGITLREDRSVSDQDGLMVAQTVDIPKLIEPVLPKNNSLLKTFALTFDNPEFTDSDQLKQLKEVIISSSIASVGRSTDFTQKLILDSNHSKEGPIPVTVSMNPPKENDECADRDKKCVPPAPEEDCCRVCKRRHKTKCKESDEKDRVKVICKTGDLKFKLRCKKSEECPGNPCGNERTKYLCKLIPQDDVCVDKNIFKDPTLHCSIIDGPYFIPEIEILDEPKLPTKPFNCFNKSDSDLSKTDKNSDVKANKSDERKICTYELQNKQENDLKDANESSNENKDNLDEKEKSVKSDIAAKKKSEENISESKKPCVHRRKNVSDTDENSESSDKIQDCPIELKNKKYTEVFEINVSSIEKDENVKEKLCPFEVKNKKSNDTCQGKKSNPISTKIPPEADDKKESSKFSSLPEQPNSNCPPCTPCPNCGKEKEEPAIKLIIQRDESFCPDKKEEEEEVQGKVEVLTLDKCSTDKIIFACRSKTKVNTQENAEHVEECKPIKKGCSSSYYTEITNAMAAAHSKTIETIKVAAEDLVNNVASAVCKSSNDEKCAVDKIKQSAEELVCGLKKKAKEADVDKKKENLKQTLESGRQTFLKLEKTTYDALVECTNKTKEFLGYKTCRKNEEDEECVQCPVQKLPKIPSPRKTSYSKDEQDDNSELDEAVRQSVEKFYETVCKSTQEAKNAIADLANQGIKIFGGEIKEEDPENDDGRIDLAKSSAEQLVYEVPEKANEISNLSADERIQKMQSSCSNLLNKVSVAKEKVTDGLVESGKKLIGCEDMEDLNRRKENIKKLLSKLSIFQHLSKQDSDTDSHSSEGNLAKTLSSTYSSLKSSFEGIGQGFEMPDRSSRYDAPTPKPEPKEVSMVHSNSPRFPAMFTTLKDKLFSIFYDNDNTNPSSDSGDTESINSTEEALIIRDREDEDDSIMQ